MIQMIKVTEEYSELLFISEDEFASNKYFPEGGVFPENPKPEQGLERGYLAIYGPTTKAPGPENQTLIDLNGLS